MNKTSSAILSAPAGAWFRRPDACTAPRSRTGLSPPHRVVSSSTMSQTTTGDHHGPAAVSSPSDPPRPPHSSHAVFGAYVHARKGSWGAVIIAVIIGAPSLLLLLFGLVGLVMGLVHLLSPSSAASGKNILVGSAMIIAIGALILWFAVFLFRRGSTNVCFYELGAVQMRWGRRNELPYAEVTRFVYSLVPQHYHGVYVGTNLKFRIRDHAKRSIGLSGRFKTKVKGGVFNRKYEATDPMETVKLIIGEQMCDTFAEQLLTGTPVEWCGVAELTPEGVRPTRGRLRNQLIPYAEFVSQEVRNRTYGLFREGDKRACISIQMNAENFQPAYLLFLRLASMQEVEEPTPSGGRLG